MDSFDYLGEKITKYNKDDIKRNLGKAGGTFNKLVKIWKSGQVGKNTEIMIPKSKLIFKQETFLHKCLTKDDIKIYWPAMVTNEGMRRRARTCTIS